MPAQRKNIEKMARRRGGKQWRQPSYIFQKFLISIFAVGLVVFVLKGFLAWQNRLWVYGGRITVVVASADPVIYSYNPQTKALTSFTIPRNTQIDTAMGYGEWLAGNLWALGKQEKVEGKILSRSLEKNLGIPIDAWIDERGKSIFESRGISLVPAIFESLQTGRFETNLSFFDRLSLFFAAGSLSAENSIDLFSAGVIKKAVLPDSTLGYMISADRAKIVFSLLRDDRIFSEGKTIGIINSSGEDGLAGEASRMLAILGMRVISLDTGKENLAENCLLDGSEKNINSEGAKRVAQIFGCKSETKKPNGPANLEIILGKNFARQF